MLRILSLLAALPMALIVFLGMGLYTAYGEIDPCRVLAVERARRAPPEQGADTDKVVPWMRDETSEFSDGKCVHEMVQSWKTRVWGGDQKTAGDDQDQDHDYDDDPDYRGRDYDDEAGYRARYDRDEPDYDALDGGDDADYRAHDHHGEPDHQARNDDGPGHQMHDDGGDRDDGDNDDDNGYESDGD